jgi:hypothetical protein
LIVTIQIERDERDCTDIADAAAAVTEPENAFYNGMKHLTCVGKITNTLLQYQITHDSP